MKRNSDLLDMYRSKSQDYLNIIQFSEQTKFIDKFMYVKVILVNQIIDKFFMLFSTQ